MNMRESSGKRLLKFHLLKRTDFLGAMLTIHNLWIRERFLGAILVTCIHVPVTVYRSGVQEFLCLV